MLKFERLQVQDHATPDGTFDRAKIPGGWLVVWNGVDRGHGAPNGMTFVYDPEHQWDGSSLPNAEKTP